MNQKLYFNGFSISLNLDFIYLRDFLLKGCYRCSDSIVLYLSGKLMILLFKTKEKSKNENKQIFIILTRNKQYKGQFFAASHHQEKLLTSPAWYNKTAD